MGFRHTLTKALVVGSAIAVGFAAVNLVAHLLYGHLHGGGKDVVELILADRSKPISHARRGPFTSHPYMLVVGTPHYAAHGFVQHNSKGYRGPEIGEKIAGRVRIVALGGSATYSISVRNPADTWPALLERLLGVEVVNAGVPYATSAEMLARYMFRDRYLSPEVVIIHAGANDIIPLWYPNYDPEYSHFRAAGARPVVGRLEHALLTMPVFRYLYARNWMHASESMAYTWHPYGWDRVPHADALRGSTEGSLEGFTRNLDLLVRTIKADGAAVVLFPEPQAREPLLARNRRDVVGKERALVVGMQRTHAVMRSVAERHKVALIEHRQDQFPDEVFTDNMHMNERGEQIKAEIVATMLHSLRLAARR